MDKKGTQEKINEKLFIIYTIKESTNFVSKY